MSKSDNILNRARYAVRKHEDITCIRELALNLGVPDSEVLKLAGRHVDLNESMNRNRKRYGVELFNHALRLMKPTGASL